MSSVHSHTPVNSSDWISLWDIVHTENQQNDVICSHLHSCQQFWLNQSLRHDAHRKNDRIMLSVHSCTPADNSDWISIWGKLHMHTKINRIRSVSPQPHSCQQFWLSCPDGHTADRVMHSTVPKVSCLLNFIAPASHLLTCFTDVLTSFTSAYLFHACLSASHRLTIFIPAYLFNIHFSVSHLLTISHLLTSFTPAHHFTPA